MRARLSHSFRTYPELMNTRHPSNYCDEPSTIYPPLTLIIYCLWVSCNQSARFQRGMDLRMVSSILRGKTTSEAAQLKLTSFNSSRIGRPTRWTSPFVKISRRFQRYVVSRLYRRKKREVQNTSSVEHHRCIADLLDESGL